MQSTQHWQSWPAVNLKCLKKCSLIFPYWDLLPFSIAAISEAFVLAAKAGADPEKVYQAIRGGLAGSTVLDMKAPKILSRDFTPGGTLVINQKDIKNVLNAAHELDVPVPYSAQLYEIMQYLKVHGHIRDDHSGIVQYFEDLADVTVCSPEKYKE